MAKRWTVTGSTPSPSEEVDEDQYKHEKECFVCRKQFSLLSNKKLR